MQMSFLQGDYFQHPWRVLEQDTRVSAAQVLHTREAAEKSQELQRWHTCIICPCTQDGEYRACLSAMQTTAGIFNLDNEDLCNQNEKPRSERSTFSKKTINLDAHVPRQPLVSSIVGIQSWRISYVTYWTSKCRQISRRWIPERHLYRLLTSCSRHYPQYLQSAWRDVVGITSNTSRNTFALKTIYYMQKSTCIVLFLSTTCWWGRWIQLRAYPTLAKENWYIYLLP